jgi:hydrogenase maturation factor
MNGLPAGKLPADLLRKLLASIPRPDRSVVIGPAVGEDAAVIDTGAGDLLVAKTDPITFAGADAGRYLLAVNGNDLAAMGAEPRWLLVTALLPQGIPPGAVGEMFGTLTRACAESGVMLVGGHTEITVGLDRPILVGCLLGTAPRGRLLRTSGARPGDALVLAGGIAIEGTAILAAEHAGRLMERGVAGDVVARAADWIREPGISVLGAARAVRDIAGVHAMHDPTEGGLATALHEIAEAAGAGVRIESAAIPVLPECAVVCRALGLDPLGLLASGALLIAVEEAQAGTVVQKLADARVPAARIGAVTAAADGRTMDGRPLPAFARDELARYLEAL